MQKTIKPQTGDNHKIFGLIHQKQHNFDDARWQPDDKIRQYEVLTLLHQKDLDQRQLRFNAEQKQQAKCLKSLRKHVHNNQELLTAALNCDIQRNKNILQNHQNLQRMYQRKPSHVIAEKMDQRTFTMRKELDLLLHKKKQLSQKYEQSLMELAKIQNRMKFEDVLDLKERALHTKLTVALKNSETRLRPIRTINGSYKKILESLKYDSVYFDPTIKALYEDLSEQTQIIETSIGTGSLALKHLEELNKEFQGLERKTRVEQQEHLKDNLDYRKTIKKTKEIVYQLVRRDVGDIIY